MADSSINNRDKQNREFVDSYELQGDGSMADALICGLRKHYVEVDAMSPEEKRKQELHYKTKMAEMLTSAKNHPGYDALFPNPKEGK